jgi:hypothetical protein
MRNSSGVRGFGRGQGCAVLDQGGADRRECRGNGGEFMFLRHVY